MSGLENYNEEIIERGIISNNINCYYIINEIANYEYMSFLTAVKAIEMIDKNNKSKYNLTKEPYSIFSFSKKYIEKTLFDDEIDRDIMSSIYKSIEDKYKRFNKLEGENILKMIDYIENDEYLYFVTEKMNYLLNDYIVETSEKSFGEGLEIEFREIICSIISMIEDIHSVKLYAVGLLDINNMYYYEEPEKVKCINPILSDLITVLKIYSNSDNYSNYSYFAPEIFNQLIKKDEVLEIIKEKKTLNLDELTEIIEFTKSDIWNLGFIIYQILFGRNPYEVKIDNPEINDNNSYRIDDIFEVTEDSLRLITGCLQLESKKRLSLKNEIFRTFFKTTKNKKIVVKELNERKTKKEAHTYSFKETYDEEMNSKKKNKKRLSKNNI
jgi:hypothetical protein